MISAVVLTKNNQDTIVHCLDSLSWCDEIVVIDDDSTDDTRMIAKGYGARVIRHSLHNNFAFQRNFALEKARGEWILFVDSDEVVSSGLRDDIQHAIQTDTYVGYRLKRQDIFFGKQLRFGETARVRLLRLGKKDSGVWKRSVHEVWDIKGRIGDLRHPLLHYSHPTIRSFIDDINRYSTLHAEELKKIGTRVSVVDIVAYPLGKFLYNYVLRQGFRDGTEGTIMAFMMSLHSFLARAKLYLAQSRS